MREKLKQEKIKKLKKILLIFVSAIVIFLVVFLKITIPKYFRHQSVFKIKKIVVEPSNYQALISTYIGNIISQNSLFLNLTPIYKNIKKCYFVENCKIEKILPDKLLINLKLRIPLFEIVNGKKDVLMDKNGYFLPFYPGFNGWIIKGMQTGSIGEKTTDTQSLKILLEILRWYNYYNIGNLFPVKIVSFKNFSKIKLEGENGSVFLYPEHFKEKFKQLQIVLETCKKENFPFTYIDLRFNQPYVEKKGYKSTTKQLNLNSSIVE
jgi:cell division septal protein FtsQ